MTLIEYLKDEIKHLESKDEEDLTEEAKWYYDGKKTAYTDVLRKITNGIKIQ